MAIVTYAFRRSPSVAAGAADDVEVASDVDVRHRERHRGDGAGGLDAGKGLHPFDRRREEGPGAHRSGVAIVDEQLGHHDVLRLEAGIDREQPLEASDEEAGAREENQGDGDLRDDEPSTQRASRPFGLALAQHVASSARELQRGDQPERNRRERREARRKGEHSSVDGRLLKANHASGRKGDDAAKRRVRERDAGGARDEGEQQALRDQLPDESRAARAERRPDRELAAAFDATREQQARDVGASNPQHEDDGNEHQQQRPADASRQVLTERHEDRARRRVGAWIFLRQLRGDRVHFALRLFERDAGREPRDDVPPCAGANALLVLLDDLWSPDRQLAGPRQQLRSERRREHADDRPWLSVQADRLVHDVGFPPNRDCQNACVMTTARRPPAVCSSGRKPRPMTGCMPMASKKPSVTCAPKSTSGAVPPV